MDKLISIVIPTYKRSTQLARALDSIFAQTHKKIEVIVVDDNAKNLAYRKKTRKT